MQECNTVTVANYTILFNSVLHCSSHFYTIRYYTILYDYAIPDYATQDYARLD